MEADFFRDVYLRDGKRTNRNTYIEEGATCCRAHDDVCQVYKRRRLPSVRKELAGMLIRDRGEANRFEAEGMGGQSRSIWQEASDGMRERANNVYLSYGRRGGCQEL